MMCPVCGDKLRVTNSYSTRAGKTQRLECESCLTVATSVIVLANINPLRGQGARALARRLKNGARVQIEEPLAGGTGSPPEAL